MTTRAVLAARARAALVKAANNYDAMRNEVYADKLLLAVLRHIRAEVRAEDRRGTTDRRGQS